MKRKKQILISLILFIMPLCGCKNIQKYAANEQDSYFLSTAHSGGEKGISCEIEEISAMNMLGSERIVITFKDKKDAKIPYYELTFTDEDREDFTLVIYGTKAGSSALAGINEGDYDLIESLSISESDGNVIIKADFEDSLKFRAEENTDTMQLVLHIKEIDREEK